MNVQMPQTPQSGRTSDRALEKCHYCRRKKIKCLPVERDFERTGKKCEACIKSSLPCSANTRCVSGSAGSPTDNVPTPLPGSMSPSQSFASTTQQSDSFPTYDGTSDYMGLATNEISNAGGLIDLFHWCQIRRVSLVNIQTLLPLFKIEDFLSAFDILRFAIAYRLLTIFRNVNCMRANVSGRDNELLTLRLFDCVTNFLSTVYFAKVDTIDIPNGSSVRDIQRKLRDELVRLYDSQGDSTTADRILQLTGDASWVRPAERIRRLSSRLKATAAKVLEDHVDIGPRLKLTDIPRFPLFNLLVQQHKDERDKHALRELLCFNRDMVGRSHLHLAAEMGDLDHLHWIYRHCSAEAAKEINTRDRFGLTPLMIAAYTGNVDVFKFFESHGANVNALDYEGRSILSFAAMAGRINIVTHILSHHPSMLKEHFRTCSPLHDAAAGGHREVIEVLLEHKAEPREERPSHGGKKASGVAADFNHKKIEAYLNTVETRLEYEANTSPADPVSQQIHSQLHSLKTQIQNAVASSQSPESGPSHPSTVRASSRRPSKRPRTGTPGTQINSPQSTFSLSETPGPLSTVTDLDIEAYSRLDSQHLLQNLQHFTTYSNPHSLSHDDVVVDSAFSDMMTFEGDCASECYGV